MQKSWVIAGLLALILSPATASAHPHVRVIANATVLFDEKHAVIGLKEHWVFDSEYSSYAMDGLEKDTAGTYTPAAYKELAKLNMESLKEYNYFSEFYVDGTKVELGTPTNAVVEKVDKDRLGLTYILPLKQPLDVGSLKVSFLIYDPEFFIAFELAQSKPIDFGQGAPSGCKVTIEPATGDISKSKTWGGAYAPTIVLQCSE